jgi:type IV pilus assembly protein PilA
MLATFRRKDGFTLIELMIAVAIIGIIAGIAIPAFMKYMKRSKTTEALVNIRKIYDGEVAYFQIDHISPIGEIHPAQFVEAGPSPANVPSGTKVSGDWSTPGWSAVKFATDGPVYYRYSVKSSGTGIDSTFSAEAEGDLDGNSISSLFRRSFKFDNVSGAIRGSGGIYTVNDIE